MLVLTRRPTDRILFPKLGISIQVVRVDGRSVRLGIDAPREVHIVRHELAADQTSEVARESRTHAAADSVELTHAMRNQLQVTLLSLHLLQRQVELGQLAAEDTEKQLCEAIAQLEAMEAGLDTRRPSGSLRRMSAPHRSRRTALLVEDNANERSLLAGYLQTYDFDVATANDGADALDYLATHDKPDVVLIDMNMPRIGGAATVHVIRSNPDLAGVKLVAVSGLAPRESSVPVGKDGVDHWFTKPIHPEELVQQLDRELTEAKEPS